MKDKLVIIGNYEKTRDLYDQSRTDADVWVFNEMLGRKDWVKRADAVFQLHAEPIWRNPLNRTDPEHCHWLQTQTEVPVYMQKRYRDVPRAVKYPLKAIEKKYLSNFNKRPFYSTPAYALALGIYLGYKTIEIYGCEMGTDTEYFWQREGFTFWLGVAVANHVQITIYTDKLLNGPIYGYEGEITVPLEKFRARINELQEPTAAAKREYEKQHAELERNLLKYRVGACDENAIVGALNEVLKTAKDYGIMDGAMQEDQRWLDRAQIMIGASGSYIFSRQEIESAYTSMRTTHGEMTLTAYGEAVKTGIYISAIQKEQEQSYRLIQIEILKEAIEAYIKATVNVAMLAGGLAEDHAWLDYIDANVRAMGGEKGISAFMEAQP